MEEKTMTAKDISGATGKTDRAVRNWVSKVAEKNSAIAEKLSASNSTHPAKYTMEETLLIIEAGLGKNAAGVWRENASQISQESSLTQRDIDLITHCVSVTVDAVFRRMKQKSSAITTHTQATQLLPPAPQLDTRSQITKVIRDYAHSTGLDHHSCWTQLYNDYNLRTHSNVRQCAKNRGMAPIDYLDDINQLEVLLSIALEIFPL